MKEDSSGMITRLLGNRRILLELVIAAVLLALSINLISSSILELKWISQLWAFVLACFLTGVCTLYFVARLLWSRTYEHSFRGFIICHKKKNEITDIPRYNYGFKLHWYMQAAFAENAAIKKMWDKEPVDKGLHYDKDTRKVSHSTGKGHQLIIEATEYYVLEKLSIHLTDYFNRPHFDEQELHTFARNDIPDVLLSNRFLELFSKPMEDRPLFSIEDSLPHHEGEVVMVVGKGGALYSRFDLTLPKGAHIRRSESNAIVLNTNRFSLMINVDFSGFTTVIPWEYQRHILGLDPQECHNYEISVRFSVSFKFASLFLPGGWQYYRWIESFMESFDAQFSKDRHFTDIGWESALTLIEYHEKQKSEKKGKRKKLESPIQRRLSRGKISQK